MCEKRTSVDFNTELKVAFIETKLDEGWKSSEKILQKNLSEIKDELNDYKAADKKFKNCMDLCDELVDEAEKEDGLIQDGLNKPQEKSRSDFQFPDHKEIVNHKEVFSSKYQNHRYVVSKGGWNI